MVNLVGNLLFPSLLLDLTRVRQDEWLIVRNASSLLDTSILFAKAEFNLVGPFGEFKTKSNVGEALTSTR